MTIPTITPDSLGCVRTPIVALSRRIAVTSAVILVLSGLSAPTASARAGDAAIYGKHGFVEFKAHGETITAGRLSNRYGVRAYLQWSRTKSASVTAGRLYQRSKNLAIPEGTRCH